MMNRLNTSFWSNIPPVTTNLIIINLICWVASRVLPSTTGFDLIETLGLHFPGAEHFNSVQFVSYMFLHDTRDFSHLFFNMFAVFMFGRTLEMLWGSKRFLLFYFITGIGAGIVQELTWAFSLRDLLFSPSQMVDMGDAIVGRAQALDMLVTIGASGAVFGILLAFGMNFPNAPIFIMFIPIPVKAKYVVAGYGLIELFTGIAGFSGDNVAHFAHLGGMLFGFFLILYWKKKYPKDGFFI
ncbi:MAG: rhomboid family intramembrane serine protease [Tannerellaceae bacterium]|nr:rhomboid family intramembrane serine protease [Tannerellaceae bacterium]